MKIKPLGILSILLFIVSVVNAQNKYSIGLGTILGGAINNEKIEMEASGEPLFGATIDFSKRFTISEKLFFTPKISYEYRQFNYSSITGKTDTVVRANIAGEYRNVPTYYTAEINGSVNSGGFSLNMLGEYKFLEKSSIIFGIYSSFFIYTNDHVNVNVQLGAGGFPDIDSTYNNGVNMRQYEYGITLGGKYYIKDNISFSIVGTRAISDAYTMPNVKNEKGEEVKFFSTYAKLFLSYYF